MRPFELSRLVVAAIVACCGSALAEGQSAPLSFDDKKAELEAQAELITKQLQVRDLLVKWAGPGMAGMPYVLAIVGLEGRLNARLQQPNGTVSTFSEGDMIRPGMVVAAITPRLVMLRIGTGKTAKAVPLEFLAGAGPGPVAGGQTGLPPLPPDLLPAPPTVRLPQAIAPGGKDAAASRAGAASPAPLAGSIGAQAKVPADQVPASK